MMTKEKFAKIVNFMTPEERVMIGCGHKSQIVTWLRQTKCIVIMTKEEYTKIVNFITPWAGVLVLGRWYRSAAIYFSETSQINSVFFSPETRQ